MKAKRSIGTIAIAAVLAAFVVLIGLQTASSQEVKKTYPSKPDVKYKINKEYDEQGNIIRFDSTYSYSWSSIDSMHVDVDSIFKQFNQNSFFDLGSMLNHNRNWANNGDSLNTKTIS